MQENKYLIKKNNRGENPSVNCPKYTFEICKNNTLCSLKEVNCFLNGISTACKCFKFVNLFKH